MCEFCVTFSLLDQHLKELSDDITCLHEGLLHLHIQRIFRKRLNHLPVLSLYAFQHFHPVVPHLIVLREDNRVSKTSEVIPSQFRGRARDGRREVRRFIGLDRVLSLVIIHFYYYNCPKHHTLV